MDVESEDDEVIVIEDPKKTVSPSPSTATDTDASTPVTETRRKRRSTNSLMYEFQNAMVSNYFDHEIYSGSVIEYDATARLWKVKYEDGDTEEMDRREVTNAIDLYNDTHCVSKPAAEKKQPEESKPKAKRPKKEDPPKKPATVADPKSQALESSFPYQGARVGKFFEGTLYYGKVMNCFMDVQNDSSSQPRWLWHIKFDDGDKEDWDLGELHAGLELYESRRRKDKGDDQPTATKPIQTDHGNFWEVDEVLDRRKKKRRNGMEIVEYLVSWKGGSYENSWVSSEQLDPNSLAEAFRKFAPTDDGWEDEGADGGPDVVTMLPSSNNENEAKSENFESDEEDDDHDEDGLGDDVNHIAASNYNRAGSAEIVINRKTYRIGMSFYTEGPLILTIAELIPEKEMADCVCFLPSNQTFLEEDNIQLPKDSYVQLGSRKTLPLSELKKPYTQTFTRSEWIYDFDPAKKHSSFSFSQTKGNVPSSITGKSRPTVLELFAGAGGMSLGFKNAGMETKWVVECNESAAATLRANASHNIQVYTEDIRDFLAAARMANPAYPKKGEVDHIHGSPPCQGFSRANRVGGDEAEENNNLTYEFVNAVRHFLPSTATYENVPGLLLEKNRPYLQSVIKDLLDLGYQVRVELLRSSDYGDPQNRRRVILWAARCHMHLPPMPQPTHGENLFPPRTVREAIGCLENESVFTLKKGSAYFNGVIDHNSRTLDTVPSPEAHVLRANRPSRTVTGCPTMLVHYNGKRYLTVRESACLQSFPWDYQFFGSTADQFKQVGNAVPVMLATSVARSVAKVYGLP